MAEKREEDRADQEKQLLDLLRKLAGSRGGDVNDFDQQYVEPTAAENYGYIDKPGIMGFTSFLPGPIGTASRVTSGMINQGNNQAIRRGREAIGLDNAKLSFIRDVLKSPKDGKIADVKIGENPQTYPVGFEAQDANKKTTLTPNEARMRGLMGGGLTEVKSAKKDDSMVSKLSRNIFGSQENQMEDDSTESNIHRGFGLANTPDGFKDINDPDLPDRQMANLNYDLEGKGRNQIPSSGIGSKVSDVVTDLLGPGYTVNVTSGQEPKGHSAVGTQYRHPLGTAADLDIRDPSGRKLSLDNPDDAQSIKDVAQGMAARYNANFGMGPEYMGPNTMHIDTMDLSKYPGGSEWASTGKAWANTLDEARATGVMPSQYYDINAPIPSQRPDDQLPSTLIAEQDEPEKKDDAFGFMGRPLETKKEQKSLPSYDSLMGDLSDKSIGITVDPNRFKDVTDDEKSLMGMTLAGEIDPGKTDLTTEAGRREAMGILSTIENRAPKYGGITEAIQAPNQYSTWNNQAAANTAANNYHGNKSTYDTLVSDYISDPANNLGFTSYHANTVNPGWSSAMSNPETIGPHTFGFLNEYGAEKSTVQPHTVFNTAASYAPHMTGVTSAENSLRNTVSSQPKTQTQTSMSNDTMSGSKSETRSSMGTGGAGSSGGSGFSSMGSGSSKSSGMTGTSGNPGKDKDDKASSGFSGGRSY